MREDLPVTNDREKCNKALEGLYYVDDPEVGLNVVDLGLIYELKFTDADKKLECIMTLTTQFCPMGDHITSSVTDSLTNDFPDWDISVDLIFEPPWDFSKISPEGKEFLGH